MGINPAFIALGASNPAFLPLAFIGTGGSDVSDEPETLTKRFKDPKGNELSVSAAQLAMAEVEQNLIAAGYTILDDQQEPDSYLAWFFLTGLFTFLAAIVLFVVVGFFLFAGGMAGAFNYNGEVMDGFEVLRWAGPFMWKGAFYGFFVLWLGFFAATCFDIHKDRRKASTLEVK